MSAMITADLVDLDLSADTKEAAARSLAERMVALGRVTDLEGFLADVAAREAQMPTGLDGGIGIPHCRSAHVTEPTLAFGRAPAGIDFGAPDGPADLVFLIAAPTGADDAHLTILSSLARHLMNESFTRALRTTATPSEAAALLTGDTPPPPATPDTPARTPTGAPTTTAPEPRAPDQSSPPAPPRTTPTADQASAAVSGAPGGAESAVPGGADLAAPGVEPPAPGQAGAAVSGAPGGAESAASDGEAAAPSRTGGPPAAPAADQVSPPVSGASPAEAPGQGPAPQAAAAAPGGGESAAPGGEAPAPSRTGDVPTAPTAPAAGQASAAVSGAPGSAESAVPAGEAPGLSRTGDAPTAPAAPAAGQASAAVSGAPGSAESAVPAGEAPAPSRTGGPPAAPAADQVSPPVSGASPAEVPGHGPAPQAAAAAPGGGESAALSGEAPVSSRTGEPPTVPATPAAGHVSPAVFGVSPAEVPGHGPAPQAAAAAPGGAESAAPGGEAPVSSRTGDAPTAPAAGQAVPPLSGAPGTEPPAGSGEEAPAPSRTGDAPAAPASPAAGQAQAPVPAPGGSGTGPATDGGPGGTPGFGKGWGGGEEPFRIVAVTSCPTGIAHTYMAAEALEQAARAAGVELVVETQGSAGFTRLAPAAVAAADAVIFAHDVPVREKDRFAGKPTVDVGVKAGINRAAALIAEARAKAAARDTHVEPTATPTAPASTPASTPVVHTGEPHDGYATKLRKWLMSGVSYMVPFVAAGGLLIALGFALGGWDIDKAPSVAEHFAWGQADSWAALMFQIGGLAFGFLVPVLAGYIAYGMADRPGLVPGFVGGAVALTINAGFLGGLVAGLVAGGTVLAVQRVPIPTVLRGIMPVVVIPLLSSVVVGFLMFLVIGKPIASLQKALTDWLSGLSGANAIVLGVILGLMMCFDLGGPVNKVAYAFAVGGLASPNEGSLKVMAAVMAAGMVPPLAMALATTVRGRLFTRTERENGKAAWVLGASFISEGAIPFAAADPLRVIPAAMAGGAVTGALSMAFECTLGAPHGGVFVIPLIGHPLLYLLAIAAGTVVSTALVVLLKSARKPLSPEESGAEPKVAVAA
ncbi:fructose-specific PTS transporter subunit EIIC [Streptomyces sp. NPDC126499]|uniref:fructose-specific PTS transporter subunit EIIC n=1 Tax=Streptomyces sp. NPDC126499 TaxID=3155314 RepID=UPI00332316AD